MSLCLYLPKIAQLHKTNVPKNTVSYKQVPVHELQHEIFKLSWCWAHLSFHLKHTGDIICKCVI